MDNYFQNKKKVDGKPQMTTIMGSGLIILVSALSAIAFPFTTYATTLFTFGIAHIAIELRYIDSRFYQNLNKTIEWRLLQLVLSIALLRCCAIFGLISIQLAPLLELFAGLGLILVATHHVYRQNWQLGILGLAVSCLCGIGIIKDPIATLVILALVHNLTPVAFILERQRTKLLRTLLICGLVFGGIPIGIISLKSLGIINFPLETNTHYLNAFVAPSWQHLSIAYPLFSAATFLQCMHYAAVIGLFSRWTKEDTETFLFWLPSKKFYWLLAGISVYFLVAFQHSFALTRAFYGIAAAIHAWLEIPLLLLLPLPIIKQKSAAIGSEISTER